VGVLLNPDKIPIDMPHTFVKLFVENITTLEETLLSQSELLHDQHADLFFAWSVKSEKEQKPLMASLDTWRKAPTHEEVEFKRQKRDQELRTQKEVQQARDLIGQSGSKVGKAAEAQVTGGGRLARLAAQPQQASGGKAQPQAGKRGGSSVAPSLAGDPNAPSTPQAKRREPNFAAVPASSFGADAAGSARGSDTGRTSVTGKLAPGRSTRSSLIGQTAPHSSPAKPPLKETFLIGESRKGSMGRALQTVDLMQVMYEHRDPGRELAAAWDRVEQFKKAKDAKSMEREEEFIELCLAGKAWASTQIAEARASDLLKHWKVLSAERLFQMPLIHTLEFTKKMVLETSMEQNYDRWIDILCPTTEQNLATWDACDPHFVMMDLDGDG
jgi:hypothetical protein